MENLLSLIASEIYIYNTKCVDITIYNLHNQVGLGIWQKRMADLQEYSETWSLVSIHLIQKAI